MKRLGRWLVMGVVAVGSAALAQGASQSGQMEQPPGHMEQQPMGGSGSQAMMLGNLPMPQDEQALANHLHHVNQMEIQLAQLALQKATSNDVKQFAQKILTDHQSAEQKLQQWAQRKNLKLSDPQATTDVERRKLDMHKSTLAFLQSVEGPPFEQGFLTGQVSAHDSAITLVVASQQQFATSDVQPLLTQLLPVLREHRDRAYKLLGEKKAPMRQARTPAGR